MLQNMFALTSGVEKPWANVGDVALKPFAPPWGNRCTRTFSPEILPKVELPGRLKFHRKVQLERPHCWMLLGATLLFQLVLQLMGLL
jgi:hypothetical protein